MDKVEAGPIRPRQLMDYTKISGRDKGIIGIKKIRNKKLCELDP